MFYTWLYFPYYLLYPFLQLGGVEDLVEQSFLSKETTFRQELGLEPLTFRSNMIGCLLTCGQPTSLLINCELVYSEAMEIMNTRIISIWNVYCVGKKKPIRCQMNKPQAIVVITFIVCEAQIIYHMSDWSRHN